jgi:hypothetical protein
MPEIINLKEQSDKTPGWAAYAALSTLSEEIFAQMVKTPGILIIELKINSTEVSFVHIINRLKEEAERWAFEHARTILEDRAVTLTETLHRLEQISHEVEQEMKRRIHKILPEALTAEDYD